MLLNEKKKFSSLNEIQNYIQVRMSDLQVDITDSNGQFYLNVVSKSEEVIKEQLSDKKENKHMILDIIYNYVSMETF